MGRKQYWHQVRNSCSTFWIVQGLHLPIKDMKIENQNSTKSLMEKNKKCCSLTSFYWSIMFFRDIDKMERFERTVAYVGEHKFFYLINHCVPRDTPLGGYLYHFKYYWCTYRGLPYQLSKSISSEKKLEKPFPICLKLTIKMVQSCFGCVHHSYISFDSDSLEMHLESSPCNPMQLETNIWRTMQKYFCNFLAR